jgi:hypothetical protein
MSSAASVVPGQQAFDEAAIAADGIPLAIALLAIGPHRTPLTTRWSGAESPLGKRRRRRPSRPSTQPSRRCAPRTEKMLMSTPALVGERLARCAMTSLDERIAAAFVDGATSSTVADLIAEAEAAGVTSGETAEVARIRALDPTLAAADVAAARREMEDAFFRRDRMQEAVRRLGDRLREVKAQIPASDIRLGAGSPSSGLRRCHGRARQARCRGS